MKQVILLLLFLFLAEDLCCQQRFRTSIRNQRVSESGIDIKIFRAFNNIDSPFLNSVVSITNHSVIPASVLVPSGLYISARANDNRYDENSSVLLALSEVLNAGVTQGLKVVVRRDRPFRTLDHVQLSETSSVSGSYSFPSGHSSGTFVMATLLTLRYPDEPLLIAGSYLYAAVTSLGRMYWGVHYPSDVLSGMLIGAGSAALIYSLRSEILPAKDKLFNQSSKPDARNRSKGFPVVLGSIAAADILNSILFSSGIPLIENTTLNYSAEGNYTLSYKLEF